MQVVGFGLSKAELSTLQCIVDPFKGQVVGANNSTEFLSAMQQIMEKATSQPNLNVSVVGADGKPLQASDICVFPQGQTENEVVCAGMFTSEYGFSLKPATYDIKITNAVTKEDSWLKNVEIKASGLIQKTITFAEGTLKVMIVNANGESVQASDICVYPQGQKENEVKCAGTFASEAEFKLSPGVYDVKASTYDNTGEKWSNNVEIKASQIVTQKITL
jgi:predicted nucleotidyltransferase